MDGVQRFYFRPWLRQWEWLSNDRILTSATMPPLTSTRSPIFIFAILGGGLLANCSQYYVSICTERECSAPNVVPSIPNDALISGQMAVIYTYWWEWDIGTSIEMWENRLALSFIVLKRWENIFACPLSDWNDSYCWIADRIAAPESIDLVKFLSNCSL